MPHSFDTLWFPVATFPGPKVAGVIHMLFITLVCIVYYSNSVRVPHSGSGVAPMSSLSGVELLGIWEFGVGGLIG